MYHCLVEKAYLISTNGGGGVGQYVLVEPFENKNIKIFGEISRVLSKSAIDSLKASGKWYATITN